MCWQRSSHRPAAGEALDRCAGCSGLGDDRSLGRVCFRFLELQLQLVDDLAAALQSLSVQRHADPVMPDDLNQVASDASEHVEVTGVRIAPQNLLYLQRQPVHAFAHVGPTDCQPNPNPGRDHRRARTSRTRRSAFASTAEPTRTQYPPGTSISIVSITLCAGAVSRAGSAATVTGTSAGPARRPSR